MIAVIPMAGHGARFSRAGYKTPKPLLPLRGQPLLYWAARSVPLELVSKLVFVVLREHDERYGIVACARAALPEVELSFVVLDSTPNGQLLSVMAAREHLMTDEPVLIYNADTYTQGIYPKMTRMERKPPPDRDVAGLLTVFSAPGDHWSFAREREDGSVDLVAEKRRISDLCSNGMYWFRTGEEFLDVSDEHVEASAESGEFYVAPVYNRLIARSCRVEVERVTRVLSFGTPEEYAASGPVLERWLR